MSHKSSKDDLEAFFFEVLPEYDEDRVYASDIKKVVQWYNLLIDQGFTNFSEDQTQKVTEDQVRKDTEDQIEEETHE